MTKGSSFLSRIKSMLFRFNSQFPSRIFFRVKESRVFLNLKLYFYRVFFNFELNFHFQWRICSRQWSRSWNSRPSSSSAKWYVILLKRLLLLLHERGREQVHLRDYFSWQLNPIIYISIIKPEWYCTKQFYWRSFYSIGLIHPCSHKAVLKANEKEKSSKIFY